MQQHSPFLVQLSDGDQPEAFRAHKLVLEEIQSLAEDDRLDCQVQFVDQIAFQEIAVNPRSAQDRDEAVRFEKRFEGRRSVGVEQDQIRASPLNVGHAAGKDDRVPFRERLLRCFECVIADDDRVTLA